MLNLLHSPEQEAGQGSAPSLQSPGRCSAKAKGCSVGCSWLAADGEVTPQRVKELLPLQSLLFLHPSQAALPSCALLHIGPTFRWY